MGQYHIPVNLDKKEFIDPHKLGCGLKLWEQIANHPSTGSALLILLACSNGRGGGDFEEHPVVGRWAGDRIAIVGDYAKHGDLPIEFEAGKIYGLCGDDVPEGTEAYRDISGEVCKVIENELEGKFEGEGWRYFRGTYARVPPEQAAMRPDLVISFTSEGPTVKESPEN